MPGATRITPAFHKRCDPRVLAPTGIAALMLATSGAPASDLTATDIDVSTSTDTASAGVEPESTRLDLVARQLARWEVVVGGGVAVAPKYEGSDEFDAQPIPFVSATFAKVLKVDPLGGSLNVYEYRGLTLGARAGYQPGREESDSDHLRGLGDIDAGAVVGGRLGYEIGPVEFYTAIDRIIGGSDGLEAKFGADASFRHDRFLFSAGISGTWSDDNYMDAYFGVTPAQSARSGLPVYDIGAGIRRVDIDATVTYMATENWLIRGEVGVGYLIGDAADSPIVQTEVQPYGGLAIGFRF